MPNTIGTTMDDPLNIPGGIGGALGIASAALAGGWLWLQRYLSSSKLERSADAAYRALIDSQQAQIERRDARIDQEVAKNAKLAQALDDAISKMDGMQRQIAALTAQVASLQRQLEIIKPSAKP